MSFPAIRDADRAHPWVLDAVLAVFVFLLGVGRVAPGTPSDVFGHPTRVPEAFIVATAAAQSLPLIWRRRFPLPVFGVVLTVVLAQASARLAVRSDLSLMIALYGAAQYVSLRRRGLLVAGAGTLAVIILVVLRVPHLLHQALFVVFFLCCAVAASIGLGLAARARQAQLAAMAERAARLEVERDQRDQLATAAERARVSREMHDIVGHNLAVIVGLADGAAASAAAGPGRGAEALRLIAGTGRQALSELRLTLGTLREDQAGPGELRPQPGVADLPGLLAGIRAAGPEVSYASSGNVAALAPGLQLTVYRVVQEALANTLRHAGPGTSVRVALTAGATEVRVVVEDTGSGEAAEAGAGGSGDGHGLAGIRERARLAGGTAYAGPRPGGGWAVRVSLPAPIPVRELA